MRECVRRLLRWCCWPVAEPDRADESRSHDGRVARRRHDVGRRDSRRRDRTARSGNRFDGPVPRRWRGAGRRDRPAARRLRRRGASARWGQAAGRVSRRAPRRGSDLQRLDRVSVSRLRSGVGRSCTVHRRSLGRRRGGVHLGLSCRHAAQRRTVLDRQRVHVPVGQWLSRGRDRSMRQRPMAGEERRLPEDVVHRAGHRRRGVLAERLPMPPRLDVRTRHVRDVRRRSLVFRVGLGV